MSSDRTNSDRPDRAERSGRAGRYRGADRFSTGDGARSSPVKAARHRSRDGETGSRATSQPADPYELARAVAIRQLTDGPRTRAQLARAMARKQIPEDVAVAVLDRFEEIDLVDDKEFSRQWVESRHHGRGLARRALAYELRQRGVADETVKDAVAQVGTEDELKAARELVRRRAVGMRNDDPDRRVRRLAGMLARKGYGPGVAMQAIREGLAEEESQEAIDQVDAWVGDEG